MFQAQVSLRLTYGKFSYFVTEWQRIDNPRDSNEVIREQVEKRWRLVKGDPNLRVDHFRAIRIQEQK